MSYQPKTGNRCTCKPGIARDNCPACEGTGWQIDFRAIREWSELDHQNHIQDLQEASDYSDDGQGPREDYESGGVAEMDDN